MVDRMQHVFIASSKEALDVARAVKQNLETHNFEVALWDEDIFKMNMSYLDTLLNSSGYFDFLIAVFSGDDEAVIRERPVKVPRDNVVFEFGLFLGRLGPRRAFLLAERGVELFSDWAGIKSAKFDRSDLENSVSKACWSLRKQMYAANRLENFSMLPSTALAIGYYHNFLKPVLDSFERGDVMYLAERGEGGKIMPPTARRVLDNYPIIHVKLPRRLSELEPNSLRERTKKLTEVYISSPVRSFPFYFSGSVDLSSDAFELFDIPTTLRSSRIAIDMIFSKEFLEQDDGVNRKRLESREIANFEHTLRVLFPDEVEHRFVFSVMD